MASATFPSVRWSVHVLILVARPCSSGNLRVKVGVFFFLERDETLPVEQSTATKLVLFFFDVRFIVAR